MSNGTVPAVAKNTELDAYEETAIVVDGEHEGFTEEDSLSGMSPVVQSYVKSYPYFLMSDNGVFKLIDNNAESKDKEVVWDGRTIEKAILYLGHQTKTLRVGDVRDLQTDPDSWTEEEKDLVAISYDQFSKGNFELSGYGKYLVKPLREKVTTRLYVFAVFPDLPSKFKPVACSFGVTADSIKKPGSFSNLRLALERIKLSNGEPANFPLSYVMTDLYHVPDKDASGKKSYQRVAFKIHTENGKIKLVHGSRDAYVNHPIGLGLWRKIKKTHDAAKVHAESGMMSMGGSSEKTIPGMTSNDGHAPEPFSDEIPFP